MNKESIYENEEIICSQLISLHRYPIFLVYAISHLVFIGKNEISYTAVLVKLLKVLVSLNLI